MVRTRAQRALYDSDDSEADDSDYVPEEDDEYISEEYYSDDEEEPEAEDYPFGMTRQEITAVRNNRNPYSDKDETLNCVSVQKYIKACAHLRQPLYVKFWSRNSMSIKKYYGVPYFTNPNLPQGHPENGEPSFLFMYNGLHHLVLWAVEEGDTQHKWIRCRQQYHAGRQYYPRVTSNKYSTKAITRMDCIEQEVEQESRVTRSRTRATSAAAAPGGTNDTRSSGTQRTNASSSTQRTISSSGNKRINASTKSQSSGSRRTNGGGGAAVASSAGRRSEGASAPRTRSSRADSGTVPKSSSRRTESASAPRTRSSQADAGSVPQSSAPISRASRRGGKRQTDAGSVPQSSAPISRASRRSTRGGRSSTTRSAASGARASLRSMNRTLRSGRRV